MISSVFPKSLHTLGCHFSLGNYETTQTTLDMIPDLIDKKKISGKDLPTEVFIKKKRTLALLIFPATDLCEANICVVAFWKEKQVRRGGDETQYVEAIKISPAEGSCFRSPVLPTPMFIAFVLAFSPLEIGICEYIPFCDLKSLS
jgi:hypothetical protein